MGADRAQLLIAQQCADLPAARRIVQCGRVVRSSTGVVLMRSTDGYVYGSGLVTCGSPWSCLACSYKIRAKRARHVAQAVALHLAAGGGVLFGTFTISHDRGEQLAGLWRLLSAGWAYMTSGRQWVGFQADHGVVGLVKTVEVTHGRNGWHPHIHVLFFIDAPMNDFDREDQYREFRSHLRKRWITWFRAKHERNISREFGIVFDAVKPDESDQVGIYCTKVGYELAMADAKIGRREGQRHPFAIAHDAAQWGDKADVMLLREWITASKRKRSIQWTGAQVKAYVAADADKTDQELAEESQVGDEALLIVHRDVWRQLISRPDGAKARFLRLFEDGGNAFDVLYFLAELGIPAELADTGESLAELRPDRTTNPPATHLQEETQ
ncbi:MAG: hypothetical protein AAGA65_19800 [Actinomycetota bacterium]